MKKISSADEIYFNCVRNFFRLRTKFGWTADEIRPFYTLRPASLPLPAGKAVGGRLNTFCEKFFRIPKFFRNFAAITSIDLSTI